MDSLPSEPPGIYIYIYIWASIYIYVLYMGFPGGSGSRVRLQYRRPVFYP